MNCILLLNTKEMILKNVVMKQLLVTIHLQKSGQNTTEANGYQKRFGYPHSSKYLLLCSTDTGLEQHEGK